MTVESLLKVISPETSIRILRDKERLYVGYSSILTMQSTPNTDNSERLRLYNSLKDCNIKHFAAVPEIRHKEWKNKNLMPPIEPDKLAEYSFSDLQMDLYYTIFI